MAVRAVLRFWLMVLAFVVGLVLFGPLTLIVTPFVLMVIWDAANVVRRRRRSAVLGYLDQAIRLNHPLPDVLDIAAISEGGITGKRLRALSLNVGYGEPIGRALEKTVPEMGQHATQLIATAERTGQLGPTIRRLLDHDRLVQHAGRHGVWFDWVYPLMIIGMTLAIVLATAVVVLPKYQEIFADFGTAMPGVTESLFSVLGFGHDTGVLAALLMLLAFGWLVLSYEAAGGALLPTPPRAHSTLRDMGEALLWYVPFVRSILTARGLTDVCYSLSLSTRAGVPMHRALVEASQLHLNPGLRRRVLNWADRIEAGESIDDAARRAGLPELLSGMLASATRSDSIAAVFAFLSRYYDGRFSRTLLLLRGGFLPAATLAMGALVTWIVLALFTPMIHLIDAVLEATGLT